jgi:leucyl/phenylalanyl-tRNA--protein transferase
MLNKTLWFTDPDEADAEGLVAVGGDLQPDRLLEAYRRGSFPWSVSPISWWSPDPRGEIELDEFRVPKSLAKLMRRDWTASARWIVLSSRLRRQRNEPYFRRE